MRHSRWIFALGLTFVSHSLFAHRLDEYLQSATFALGPKDIALVLRLTPGVAVLDALLPAIDLDGDGQLTADEQHAYATRVVRDLAFSVDGKPVPFSLATVSFPPVEELQSGLGDIVLAFDIPLPAKAGARRLTFANRHRSEISAYLVNCLQPAGGIAVLSQERNFTQSTYQLDFSVPALAPPARVSLPPWLSVTLASLLGACVVFVLGRYLGGAARESRRLDVGSQGG